MKTMTKRLSIWWKFKQLDRTYQPLLKKALAFENREALLKLEEQYWYQTACLLEERRELRKAEMTGMTAGSAPRRHMNNGNSLPKTHAPRGRFGSEREITYQHRNAAWKFMGLVLTCVAMVGGLLWYFVINPSTRLITLAWLP